MSVLAVTKENLQAEVISSPQTVLLDFWAPWCGPCKAMSPILDELARDLSGKVTIAKLNIEDHPATAAGHNVRAIPTLLLFKDGKLADTLVGMQSKAVLISRIQPHL